jgi:ABC-type amino acid transport substrate-binding protein
MFPILSDVAIFDSFLTFVDKPYVELIPIKEEYKLVSAFALQKGSEFKGIFNYHLGKIKSSGLMQKNELKWLRYFDIICNFLFVRVNYFVYVLL